MNSLSISGNGCEEIQRCSNGVSKTQPHPPFPVLIELKFDSVRSHPSYNECFKRIVAACKDAVFILPLFPYIRDELCQFLIYFDYEFIEIRVAGYWNDKRNTDFCASRL